MPTSYRVPTTLRSGYDRLRTTPTSARVLRTCTIVAIVANAGIVVTGGAVRLSNSGLGCPTWPDCTNGRLLPGGANTHSTLNQTVEFGNRVLGVLVLASAVAVVLAVWRLRPRRRRLLAIAWTLPVGFLAQAVLGGVTVLTGLNPWSVMAHFLLSMVLIALAVLLHRRVGEGDEPPRPLAPVPLRRLGEGLLVVVGLTLAAGTVVTGSGPHAGDPSAGRTGLDPQEVSQLHADLVMLLVGLSVAFWVALRSTGADPRAVRAAAVLVVVELAQGLLGFVQYFTNLPVLLVGAHLAGACVVLVAACRLLLALRDRGPVAAPPGPVPVERELSGSPA